MQLVFYLFIFIFSFCATEHVWLFLQVLARTLRVRAASTAHMIKTAFLTASSAEHTVDRRRWYVAATVRPTPACVPLSVTLVSPDDQYDWLTAATVDVRDFPQLLVRERSALSDPYCQSTWNSVCLFVCLFVCLSVRDFEVKYLGNQRS